MCVAGVCGLLALLAVARPAAHPMPNSLIAVTIGDDGATFDVAVPVPDLRLALPASWPNDADLLADPWRSQVASYFSDHAVVSTAGGPAQHLVVQSLAIWDASDAAVGAYQELHIRMFVPASGAFTPRRFTLTYDAIIHQVPTHFAIVEIVQDFRAGLLPGAGSTPIGAIRFDFARRDTPPIEIAAAASSVWRGTAGMIALGFHHVAGGLDHVLFLLTLLVVAPLRVVDGRWSLFQGWPYTLRRFVAISLAFTLGHSIALLIGAYDVFPVPRGAIEVVIAGSILVAALHATHPLFSGREWIVAAAFGTVHGLAFSESLAGLTLTPLLKGVAVLGFNLGVEGAQLAVMAAAVPLLVMSRWRVFHAFRIAAMIGTAVLAGLWMYERATGTIIVAATIANLFGARDAMD